MKNAVDAKVAEYMNVYSIDKLFTIEIITIIRKAIKEERKERIFKKLNIDAKTKRGRQEINKRTALIANVRLKKLQLSETDIHLYKVCRIQEYEESTGRCAWSIPKERIRRGFDPKTGLG